MAKHRKEAPPLDHGRRTVRRPLTAEVVAELDPDRNLHALIEHMEYIANALLDGKIPEQVYGYQNKALAEKVREILAEQRAWLASLSPLDRWHVFELMWAASCFADLDADLTYSGPVNSYQSSRRKPSVSDEQVVSAVAAHPKKKDAAAALGLEPRQLRERLKKIKKAAI